MPKVIGRVKSINTKQDVVEIVLEVHKPLSLKNTLRNLQENKKSLQGYTKKKEKDNIKWAKERIVENEEMLKRCDVWKLSLDEATITQ